MTQKKGMQKFAAASLSLLSQTFLAGLALVSLALVYPDVLVTYVLVAILGLMVAITVGARLIAHSLDLAEPGLWFALFYFFHFGARAIWDLVYGSPFLGFGPWTSDLDLLNVSLATSILGFLFFQYGYSMKSTKLIARSIPQLPHRWNIRRALLIAILSAAVGWSVRIYLASALTGGIWAWIIGSKDELLRSSAGVTYLSIISQLAIVALYILFFVGRIGRQKWHWLLFWALFVLEILFELISGKRGSIVWLLGGLLIAYYMTSDRSHRTSLRLLRWSLAIFFLFILFLFPLTSAIRFSGIAGIRNTSFVATASRTLYAVGYRLPGLDSLALIIDRVPRDFPYTQGSELKYLVVAWIPRKLWPEKPTISLGKVFLKDMVPTGVFPEDTSVSVTLPGEFYWAFGTVGVLIGMMLTGVLWRFMYEYFVRAGGNLSHSLIVAVMFSSFFIPLEQSVLALFSMHLFKLFLLMIVTLGISVKANSTRGGIGEYSRSC